MGRLVFALAGPTVWFLLFPALYALETWACTPSAGLPAPSAGVASGGAVVAATAMLVAVAASQYAMLRRDGDYLATVGLMLTGISAIAGAWISLPVLLMRSCS